MDVKSAFLYGDLKEEVYVEQPKGFEDFHHSDYVYRLKKALYGLKQAPRAWYDKLASFLIASGYTRGSVDNTLFYKRFGKDFLVAQIYVDDIVFGSTNAVYSTEFSNLMTSKFQMSMVGELTMFLGLQVNQNSDGIFVSQTKYAKDLIARFGLKDSKGTRTPMSTKVKLTKDDTSDCVCPKLYRSMIGSLLYLCASRPDISFSVHACARFQVTPRETHLAAVKRIIRYVRSTASYGLWYVFSPSCQLLGYSDADWAGNMDTRKSTSGGCFFVGANLTSWFCKKQLSVSLSTTEAEYIAAASACTQLVWMRQMMTDYGLSQDCMTLFCDNLGTMLMTKNAVFHSRTKHIDIRHHYLRELVENKDVEVKHVVTKDQLADILTKPLDCDRFEELRRKIGVVSPN